VNEARYQLRQSPAHAPLSKRRGSILADEGPVAHIGRSLAGAEGQTVADTPG
jgi:hypothetical protein